jgi:outer membrane autotransporter protein
VLSGANTYSGATTVAGGTLDLTGSINGSASLTNSGIFQLESGSSATFTGAITNNSVINNLGGMLSAASFTNNSTINAFGGTFAEAVTNASGASFNVTSAASVTVSGVLTNNGIINSGTMTNYGTVNDDLTNTGTLNNYGTYNVTGTLNNSGTINMVNGSPTNVVNVSGLYAATGAATLNVDASLNTSAGQRSDLLNAGSTSGNTVVNVNAVGTKGYFATPIPVVQVTGASAGTFTAGTGLQSAGIVNYSLQRVGNNYDIVATLNPGAAPTFATSIASSLAAINVGFFQNASAFISSPPDPKPNQIGGGPWIRFADGRNDVNSVGTTQNVGGATTTNSLVRTTFNGFQTGIDLGVFNIENSGYNVHFGVTAGQVLLSASELQSGISTNQVTVPFLGIYGAFTGHNFFADFQVREDLYSMKITNPTALLYSSNLSATGISANGSLGYRFDVTKQFFVEPSLALLYSQLHVNPLQVGISPADNVYGSLSFSPINSLIGRAGLRVGTNYSFDTIALQPFLTGSVWREFEGDTTSSFSAAGGNVPISVSRIGTFEQVGLGVAGQVLNTGLLGFVRGDYRFGDNLRGYALNAGMRYQF